MDSSNLNDMCFICLNQLVTGSECKDEACRNLSDNNVEIIERFANAWKEEGSSCYNKCINMCQKYKKEKKKAASFHVMCYRKLLSNATYLDECKKKSQATVKENEHEHEARDAVPEAISEAVSEAVPTPYSNALNNSLQTLKIADTVPQADSDTLPQAARIFRELPTLDSNATNNSLETSEIASCDTDSDTLPQAARILRESLLKLPNGIYNDYTDDPLVYTFFASLCGADDDDIPSKNEELNKKILFLCQEFANAVHKHQHQDASNAVEEDMIYLGRLVIKTVLSTCD